MNTRQFGLEMLTTTYQMLVWVKTAVDTYNIYPGSQTDNISLQQS